MTALTDRRHAAVSGRYHILRQLGEGGTADGFLFSVSAPAHLARRPGQCPGRVLLSQVPLAEQQPHHRRAGLGIRCSR
jgi:hypothetical protein